MCVWAEAGCVGGVCGCGRSLWVWADVCVGVGGRRLCVWAVVWCVGGGLVGVGEGCVCGCGSRLCVRAWGAYLDVRVDGRVVRVSVG